MLEKMKAWQERQRVKGEARMAELKEKLAEQQAEADARAEAIRAKNAPKRAALEARRDALLAQQEDMRARSAQLVAERYAPKAATHGKLKTPAGSLKFSDGMLFGRVDGKRHAVLLKFVRDIALEEGATLRSRSTLARTGGGALAGGLLLGPVGLLAGAGMGAVAKKTSGGEKFLLVESDAGVFLLEVPRAQVAEAQRFAAGLRGAVKEAQQ